MLNLGDIKAAKAKDRLHTTLVCQLFMILKKRTNYNCSLHAVKVVRNFSSNKDPKLVQLDNVLSDSFTAMLSTGKPIIGPMTIAKAKSL
jgi:hypothetical protein